MMGKRLRQFTVFDDFFEILTDNPFEEDPVDAKTFVESPDYLGQPPLSDIQYDIVQAMSQIYRKEDLQRLLGDSEGSKYYAKYTKNEVILQLGKGCNAPYTPTFNPQSGKWERLDSLFEGMAATMSGNTFATEAFFEGFGKMLRVKTALGFVEDVYVGHKYFWMPKNKFYKRKRDNNQGIFEKISNISVGDRIAIGLNLEPSSPKNVLPSHAELAELAG